MERVARLEPGAQKVPCLRLVVAVSTAVHSGGSWFRRSKHQSAYAFATAFLTLSEPKSSNSRLRTTSLISASSLAMRSLATRRTTLFIFSCHWMSYSVISTWLRGQADYRRRPLRSRHRHRKVLRRNGTFPASSPR